jgi:hypothetical protein
MNELRSRAVTATSLLSGLSAAALLALGVASAAHAQPAGQMKSLSHNIHAVNNLDTTLAFYKDVFGLEGRATDFANPAVPLLTNAPGVTLRMSMLSLPGGPRYELTHFKGLERQPAMAKYTDPGAASVVLYVRDIDTLVAAARRPMRDRHDRRRTHPRRNRHRPRALDRATRPGRLLLAARRGRPGGRRQARFTGQRLLSRWKTPLPRSGSTRA